MPPADRQKIARKNKRPSDHLDIRSLKAFVRLAHSGSFQQTANQLQVSTSALSQTIQQLEQQLGQTLFDRSTRPVCTTRYAEQILPAVQQLVDDALALEHRIVQAAGHGQQRLRLGCIDSFAATVGPALIAGLDTQNNAMQLFSGLTPDITKQLVGHEIDFAVCTDPMTEHESIHCTSLFHEWWIAVLPKALAPRTLKSGKDLIGISTEMDFVRYSLRSRIGIQIERFLVHHGIRAPRRFELDATDSLLSLVSAGMGWAISSPLCLLQSRHYIDMVQIVALPRSTNGSREFYLLWRDDTPRERAETLVRMIRQVLMHRTLPDIKSSLPALDSPTIVLSEQGS